MDHFSSSFTLPDIRLYSSLVSPDIPASSATRIFRPIDKLLWCKRMTMDLKLVTEEYAENVERTNIIKPDHWRKQNLLTDERTLIVPKKTVSEMCRAFIDGSKKILIT